MANTDTDRTTHGETTLADSICLVLSPLAPDSLYYDRRLVYVCMLPAGHDGNHFFQFGFDALVLMRTLP